jgi:hypothetical protein
MEYAQSAELLRCCCSACTWLGRMVRVRALTGSRRAEEQRRMAQYASALAMLDIKHALTTGLSRLAAIACHLGLVPHVNATFGSAELRFKQRFESFEILGDGLYIPYERVVREITIPDGAHMASVVSACIIRCVVHALAGSVKR